MTQLGYNRPLPGQQLIPFVANSVMWHDIINMLTDWRSGALTNGQSKSKSKVRLRGSIANGVSAGKLVYMSYKTTGKSNADKIVQLNPTLDLEAPSWHDKIDNVLPVFQSIGKGSNSGAVYGDRMTIADCQMVDASHRYAMVDPTTPAQLKSGDQGIFKVVCYYPDQNKAVVDTSQGYFNWRFQLTEDWADASATAQGFLLNWDGTTFDSMATTIEDPDSLMRDLKNGDTGYCHNVGNRFIAYQAPCEITQPTITPDPNNFPDP